MKTLKYIALFGLAGLLLGSCTEEPGLSEQNKGKTKPVVTLTQGTATDGTLTFTVAADATASQYGYVIVEGKDNEAPAPYDIVVDEVSGVVDSKVFSSADAASNEVTFECDSNADYQVFAAAITSTGLVGDVTSLNIFVTDTVIPEIIYDDDNGYSYEYQESMMAIEYTEPVTYVEGKEITATLWAGYNYKDNNVSIYPGVTFEVYPYISGNAAPVGTATATVETDGEWVILDFGDMVPGTVYTISIPDGAFVDAAGNEAPGLTSEFGLPYFYQGEPAFEWVLFGHTSNAPVEITLPEQTTIEDLDEWLEVTTATMVVRIDNKLEYTTTIKHEETVNGVKTESTSVYPMEAITNYRGDLYKLLLKPAGTPKPKDEITINVPAGAITDIYGNTSEAFTVGPFKYAYTPVYPTPGVYVVNNGDDSFQIKLSALDPDDPEGPYALQADWFGLFGGWGNPILYLTLDEPSRTLTCDGSFIFSGTVYDELWGTVFYTMSGGAYELAFYGGGDDGETPITITYGDDGALTTISYCEYAIFSADSGAYLGPLGFVDDGTTISVPSSSSAVGKKAKAANNLSLLSEPKIGLRTRK